MVVDVFDSDFLRLGKDERLLLARFIKLGPKGGKVVIGRDSNLAARLEGRGLLQRDTHGRYVVNDILMDIFFICPNCHGAVLNRVKRMHDVKCGLGRTGSKKVRRCEGMKKDGTRCNSCAVAGTSKCFFHTGKPSWKKQIVKQFLDQKYAETRHVGSDVD